MKIRKNAFLFIIGVMMWGVMSINNIMSMAIGRSVQVDNDDDFKSNSYSVGGTYTDYGALLCAPTNASYQNTKHSDKFKELEYSYYKMQVNTEVRSEYSRETGTDEYISLSGMPITELKLAYKRYAYAATHSTSSSSSGVVGNAYVIITKEYSTDGVLVRDALLEENVEEVNTDLISECEQEFYVDEEISE